MGNVAQLLLDVTDNLPLGGGGEGVAPLGEDLHKVVGELTASQVKTDNGMGESVTLVDGNTMGDTVTGVHDDTSGTSRGVQGEHSLDGDVHGGHVEGLEHDLGHLLPVGLGVEGSLSKEDGLLLGGNTELVVEVWCQIFSMSSQLVMMPCSTGYFRVRIPLLDWASSHILGVLNLFVGGYLSTQLGGLPM